jgi:RNAse (barnase) inhibitor barstar
MPLLVESFRFEPDVSGKINGRSFHWRLPTDIAAKHELMTAFERELWFPLGFGRNWDALSDCLRDLEWMPDHKVVLVHEALPRLSDSDLSAYLSVLSHAVLSWRGESEHELEVVFPESERSRVQRLLQAVEPQP